MFRPIATCVLVTLLVNFLLLSPVLAIPSFSAKRIANLADAWGDYEPRGWDIERNKLQLANLKELGFDAVRIGVKPKYLPNFQSSGDDVVLTNVRQTVQAAVMIGLKVIVTLHSEPSDIYPILGGEKGGPAFGEYGHRVWRMAKFVSEFAPEKVAVEPINQPLDGSIELWKSLLQSLWQKCRDASPKHTIVLDGANWASIDGLEAIPAISDGNTYAAFNFNEPHQFVFQGAAWAPPPLPSLRSLPFPVSREGIDKALSDSLKSLALEQQELWRSDPARLKSLSNTSIDSIIEYSAKGYDRNWLARRFEKAAAWSRARKIPLILVGFGAIPTHAPYIDVIEWYRSVRKEAERHEIAFGPSFLWHYQQKGAEYPNDTLLEALGLRQSDCNRIIKDTTVAVVDNSLRASSVLTTLVKGQQTKSQLKFSWSCPPGTSGFVSWFKCTNDTITRNKSAQPTHELIISGLENEHYWFGVACSDAVAGDEPIYQAAEQLGFAARM